MAATCRDVYSAVAFDAIEGREGYPGEVVDRVLEMVAGMVDPHPMARWDGDQIAQAAAHIKQMAEAAKSSGQSGDFEVR